ncbi:hypothetical protein SLS55_006049 [Diplodia seriata]|uniref:Pentatricopeptide repeat domain-containing protein n=1 Tax=Diplodia seriata TaxID=420778 RepID=A0ABR3CD27_9PEZI
MAPRRNSHAIYADLPSFEIPGRESAPESTREAETVLEAVSEIAGRQYQSPLDLPRTASAKPIDYKKHLPSALRARETYTIYRCMVDGAHDTAFVSSVPPVTFTEILRLIGASSELEQTKNALEHSWWMRGARFPSINASMDKFVHATRLMMAIRKQANIAVRLADYKLLLGCAAAASDRFTALDLWRDLQQDGLEPDIECYNAIMHAVLWDRRMRNGSWRNPLSWKVDNFFLSARENGVLPYGLSLGGYEKQVKEIFDELLGLHHVGDETTVIHLITAYAREGNIMGVKDILRRVWNIHVDELTSAGAQRSPPRRFEASAPLHPTPRLLDAVGHAFGTNGDVPAALRTVDFISTTYKLAIPPAVWSELLTWTYVQSMPLSGRAKLNHGVANPLSLGAAERLWQTLTAPPYNVRPTMKMFHLSIKRLTGSHCHDAALDRIRDGVALYRAHVAAARAAAHAMRGSQVVAEMKAGAAGLPRGRHAQKQSRSSLVATRDARVTTVRRDRAMIRRWCNWYLKRGFGQDFPWEKPLQQAMRENDGYGGGAQDHQDQDQVPVEYVYDTPPDWAERVVPDFIAEFADFCPPVVRYRTHTGGVTLELREFPAADGFRRWLEEGVAAEDEVEHLWEMGREKRVVRELLEEGIEKKVRPRRKTGRRVGSDVLPERETGEKRDSEALTGKEEGQSRGLDPEQVASMWRASGFTVEFVGSKGQRIRERQKRAREEKKAKAKKEKPAKKQEQAREFEPEYVGSLWERIREWKKRDRERKEARKKARKEGQGRELTPEQVAEQVASRWRASGFTPEFVGSKGQRIRERQKRDRDRKKARKEGEVATV